MDRSDLKVLGKVKPRLRGISHLVACIVAIVASVLLVYSAPTVRAKFAGGVYGLTLALMLGASALYHIPTWTPRKRQWLRRLDHGSIFLFLGGSYTPFCMFALPPDSGTRLLVMAWLGATAGMLKSLVWIRAPRAISAGLYVLLGWMVIPYVPGMVANIGLANMLLVFAGGLCYTVGAIIYLLKKPDPAPTVFGYHEIFHCFVIAGCALQFVVVWAMVLNRG